MQNTMKMYILWVIFLGIVVRNSYSIRDQPEQNSSNQSDCWTEDQHLPHETKCHLYYRCVYGKKILKICPTNKLFNTQIANCDDNYNVNCGLLDIDLQDEGDNLFSIDEIDWEKDGSDPSSENDRDLVVTDMEPEFTTPPSECPEVTDPYEDAQLLPHENDCNAFYKCFNGKKYLMSCPGILQFNPKIFVCDWPMNVKCRARVQSTEESSTLSTLCPQTRCQESTVYLPHPKDVRHYIRCENGKEVAEECPDGLVFDPNIHTCNFPA
ncbi:unnamed protein product [Phaedon cochleariae]|uniref:Chitin-binding type-2 domain-containing protein n=1 Tax=Phaedon cochleariae TaxID=80249 RepID=A0A9P0GQ72_PHACE|nr:unnamed protein product [Phaedon cochleariae]